MNRSKEKRAVVLLSGGLDSATTLYVARSRGYKAFCLVFDYGQRHGKEIRQAKAVARHSRSSCQAIKISLPWGGSALLDKTIPLPQNRPLQDRHIPVTYVPARNLIFLSFAASYAEAMGAQAIFIGANALDYSGYPDCRPEFFRAFRQTLARGLKISSEGRLIKVEVPLLHKTKAEIIRLGLRLRVPYHLTWSCYQGGRRVCGKCDSCRLRERGFSQAGIRDPISKQ